MQNPQIIEIIENLKGRRDYEEKKATKLGFNSLYAYFENKLLQEKTALEESAKELEAAKAEAELLKEEKKEPKKLAAVVKVLNF
jgi:flagellin-specific chaperone FliS